MHPRVSRGGWSGHPIQYRENEILVAVEQASDGLCNGFHRREKVLLGLPLDGAKDARRRRGNLNGNRIERNARVPPMDRLGRSPTPVDGLRVSSYESIIDIQLMSTYQRHRLRRRRRRRRRGGRRALALARKGFQDGSCREGREEQIGVTAVQDCVQFGISPWAKVAIDENGAVRQSEAKQLNGPDAHLGLGVLQDDDAASRVVEQRMADGRQGRAEAGTGRSLASRTKRATMRNGLWRG